MSEASSDKRRRYPVKSDLKGEEEDSRERKRPRRAEQARPERDEDKDLRAVIEARNAAIRDTKRARFFLGVAVERIESAVESEKDATFEDFHRSVRRDLEIAAKTCRTFAERLLDLQKDQSNLYRAVHEAHVRCGFVKADEETYKNTLSSAD
jgi:hypothetical protein